MTTNNKNKIKKENTPKKNKTAKAKTSKKTNNDKIKKERKPASPRKRAYFDLRNKIEAEAHEELKEVFKPKKIMGRPTKYSKELADRICIAVATTSAGLTKICNMNKDFPDPDSIQVWRQQYKDFSVKYNLAKRKQADLLAETCLDIADDSEQDLIKNEKGETKFNAEFAARAKIRIDTRKWLASKLMPKVYGDRMLLEQKTEENEQLKKELKELRAKLDAKNKKDY